MLPSNRGVIVARISAGATQLFVGPASSASSDAMNVRPEVLECYEVTGTFDYTVKMVFGSMDDYHDFLHNVLVKLPGISQINTSVALREVKYETALPL